MSISQTHHDETLSHAVTLAAAVISSGKIELSGGPSLDETTKVVIQGLITSLYEVVESVQIGLIEEKLQPSSKKT